MNILKQAEQFAYRVASSESDLMFDKPSWLNAINAHLGDEHVGSMTWGDDGELDRIQVHPEWQRQGIATAMFNYVKERHEPKLHHSPHMTDEGHVWSQSMGYDPKKWHRLKELP